MKRACIQLAVFLVLAICGHANERLGPANLARSGIRLVEVQKADVTQKLHAFGKIAYDPELFVAQQDLISAQRSGLASLIAPSKLRLKSMGLSDDQIAQLTKLPSQNLLASQPNGFMWVYAAIFENDLPFVKAGLRAEVSGPSLGAPLVGYITSVDQKVDAASQTSMARILVRTPYRLSSNASVDVSIELPLGEQFYVSEDAVLYAGDKSYVFVQSANGKFEAKPVAIKARSDGRAVVTGLTGNERVVAQGGFLIDSETRLAPNSASQSSAPKCPKGEFWHAQMQHCMPLARDTP